MKKIFIGIGLAAVLIIGAGIYLASNLESIIKAAIEDYGSQAAGAAVTVGGVDIELKKGTATIYSLALGNPPGFDTPDAFKMRRISVSLNTDWKPGDTIVINEILVDKPKVTYELGADGSNFSVLKANIEKAVGSSAKAQTGSDTKTHTQTGAKTSVIIDNFRLQNGEIAASATILGGKTLSLPLPDLHLTDIGKDKGGISPDEVAQKILSALENNVTKAMTNIDLGVVGDAAKAAKKTLDTITDTVTDGAAGVVDDVVEGAVGGAATKAVDQKLDDASDAVKSLFGN